MGNYTIIADTSAYLIELLQKALVPELISDVSEIGLRSPEEKGDIVLGVFLYDVRQSEEVFQQLRTVAKERISKPPLYLSICYMITAYGKGDAMYRLIQEEQILGRVIQIFYDNSIIPIERIDSQTTGDFDLHIQMMNPDIDEKSKIWSFPNVSNRLSLFYKVSPIAIDSAVSRKFSRVTEVDIHVGPKPEK
ncbi:MAG: DUF4255 domain-containing protein [Lachnospiraceae bacterium]|jgi:hypothetical protein